MCLNENGLHVQKLLTILVSILNIIEGEALWPFNELKESLLVIRNEIFHTSSENYEGSGYRHDMTPESNNRVFCILRDVGASLEVSVKGPITLAGYIDVEKGVPCLYAIWQKEWEAFQLCVEQEVPMMLPTLASQITRPTTGSFNMTDNVIQTIF